MSNDYLKEREVELEQMKKKLKGKKILDISYNLDCQEDIWKIVFDKFILEIHSIEGMFPWYIEDKQ